MSRQIIRLNGVNFNNPALPVINPLPIEKHIANLPGLRFWFDPQATVFEPNGAGEGIRDRKALLDSTDYGSAGYTLNTAIGGKPSLTLTRSPAQGLRFAETGALSYMASGYTIFAVGKRMEDDQTMVFTACELVGGVALLRFMVLGANDRPTIYHSNSVAGGSLYQVADNDPHLFMVSWDAQSGTFVIEVDGVNSGISGGGTTLAAPASLASVEAFGIGATGGIATNSNGSIGFVLHLDRAYHMPQYAQVKADLVEALMDHYGI
jgi:hypothetical protein